MLNTKVAYLVNPLLFIEKEGNLQVAFDYTKQRDVILGIQGFNDLKLGRASNKDVWEASKIMKDPRIRNYRTNGSGVSLVITKEVAERHGTTPLHICTELLIKYANSFIRDTYGTQFYVRKYRC